MSEHLLVVNGSPRAEKGITSVVIGKFLEGCHESGAGSEVVHVARSTLNHCCGELACFFDAGARKCRIHKHDQGAEFADKWIAADRIVLASPLHFNTVSAHLMRFLERLVCTVDPLYAENDGFPTHQGPCKGKPSAVIGVCAYPGVSNFNLFREVMINLQKVFWLEPGGDVLVPMCRDLTVLSDVNPRYQAVERVVSAIVQAGREFMSTNEITVETEDAISADSDELEVLRQEFNGYFMKLGARI
jgi:multimeric flavodoxin WrbA